MAHCPEDCITGSVLVTPEIADCFRADVDPALLTVYSTAQYTVPGLSIAGAVGYNYMAALIYDMYDVSDYATSPDWIFLIAQLPNPILHTIISASNHHRYRVTIDLLQVQSTLYTSTPELVLQGVDLFFSAMGVDHTRAYTVQVFDTVLRQTLTQQPYDGPSPSTDGVNIYDQLPSEVVLIITDNLPLAGRVALMQTCHCGYNTVRSTVPNCRQLIRHQNSGSICGVVH